jgi:Cysteine rich repeat
MNGNFGRSAVKAFLCAALAAVSISLARAGESPAFQAQPLLLMPEIQAAKASCAADIEKFCASIVPGGGRIARCLAANRKEVASACIESMLKAKAALGR